MSFITATSPSIDLLSTGEVDLRPEWASQIIANDNNLD